MNKHHVSTIVNGEPVTPAETVVVSAGEQRCIVAGFGGQLRPVAVRQQQFLRALHVRPANKNVKIRGLAER